MLRCVVGLALLVCFSTAAEAAGPLARLFRIPSRPRSSNVSSSNSSLSAMESATISANEGRMAHRGGSYAFEGVGFSSASADAALRNCCYYGQKTIVESAVVRGSNGWYACIRYR